jgi:hypothetical protein
MNEKEKPFSSDIEEQLATAGISCGVPIKDTLFVPTDTPHVFTRRLWIWPFRNHDDIPRTSSELHPLLAIPSVHVMLAHGKIDQNGTFRFLNDTLVEEAVRLYEEITHGVYPLSAVIACQSTSKYDTSIYPEIPALDHLIYPRSLAKAQIDAAVFVKSDAIPLIMTSPAWHFPSVFIQR